MDVVDISVSAISFLIQLIAPAFCIALYFKKKAKGALFIAMGFIIQLAVLAFVPLVFLELNLFFSPQIANYVNVITGAIFVISFVYGMLLLVNSDKSTSLTQPPPEFRDERFDQSGEQTDPDLNSEMNVSIRAGNKQIQKRLAMTGM